MEFIFGLLAGGLIVFLLVRRKKPSGTLVIDFSDPNKDIFRFEFDEDLNAIYSKKKILFNVRTINDSLE